MFRPNDPTTRMLVATAVNAEDADTPRNEVTLAEGEIAFFSANAPFAKLDASSDPQRFFIAVGVGKGEFATSAGRQGIVASEVSTLAGNCFSPGQDKIIGVGPFLGLENGKDYSIKCRAYNTHTHQITGNLDFVQTFTASTPASDTADPQIQSKLAKAFVKKINDSDIFTGNEIFRANLYNVTTNGLYTEATYNAAYTAADAPGKIALENNIGVAIRALAYTQNDNITDYDFDFVEIVNSNLIVSTMDFAQIPAQETLQEFVAAQGTGRLIRKLEYNVFGWDGFTSIRRLHDGAPFGYNQRNKISKIDIDGKYVTVTITNDETIRGGSHIPYTNTVQTIIVIPCANTAVKTLVQGVLNAQLAPRTDVPALAIVANCTNCNDASPLFLQNQTQVEDNTGEQIEE